MPEFLVRIALTRPDWLEDDQWRELLAEEARVASTYRESGVIDRIWRVPGTTDNIGIWQAADPSELHERVSGLPAFRYMQVRVEPLGLHYLEEPAARGRQ